jgi:hypothetical protein
MFIRMTRDSNVASGVVLRFGETYDLPREQAQALITKGDAVLVTFDPGGYNPAAVALTGNTINNTSVGATTRSTGAFTRLALDRTDSTSTPGNVTNNSQMGRAAFAAAGTAVVVTNSSVTATSEVFVQLLGAADATLTSIVGVTVAAGSFTVTGNAAATAAKSFSFLVIN